MRELLKKHCYLAVVIAALVIGAIAGVLQYKSVDDVFYTGTGEPEALHQIDAIALTRGEYEFSINYEAGGGKTYGTAAISADHNLALHAVDSNVVLVPYYSNSVSYPVYVNTDTDGLSLTINDADGDHPIIIAGISIHRSNIKSMFYSFWNVASVLALLGCCACYIVRTRGKSRREIIVRFGLLLTALFVNLPAFLDYVPSGIDLLIHLNRIEGIAQGLRNGYFPVRMHSEMWNGFGYPFGVFYGDAFFYIPAVLYLLGLPLWKAYQIYVVLMNLATVGISYYAFKMIREPHGDASICGLIGSFIYSFGMWHLSVIHGRAAVGAYTAFAFIPLIIASFFILLRKEYSRTQDGRRTYLMMVVGFAGVTLSHMLTLEIISMFTAVICLIYFKRLFQNGASRILLIIKAAVTTLLLTACYLVPVMTMLRKHDLYLSNFTSNIQKYGVYLPQIFYNKYNTIGLASELPGISEDWPQTMGLACILATLLAIYMVMVGEVKLYRKAIITGIILSILAIYMSLYIFPYDYLNEHIHFLYSLLARVQTPNRYLLAATLLMTLVCMLILFELIDQHKKTLAYAFTGMLCGLTLIQGLSYLGDYNYSAMVVNAVSADDALTVSNSDDYLYTFNMTDFDGVYNDYSLTGSAGIELANTSRYGSNYSFDVRNDRSEEGYADAPLFNYMGYEATGADGATLQITDGDNHKIRVMIPKEYDGTVQISYHEPIVWRMLEIIGLLTCCGVVLYAVKTLKNNMRI